MTNGNLQNIEDESKRRAAHKLLAAAALAVALILPTGMALRAQPAPQTPPAPQAVPEPPEPPDTPDPLDLPEPPDPSEQSQIFLFNDHSVHLGVVLDEVTAQKAQDLKLPAVAGALVTEVQKGSAAEKAGLQAGDVITDFDGIHVRSSAELRRLIRETPSGRTVEIKVVREGRKRILSAKLEASKNQFWWKPPGQQYYPEIIPPPGEHSFPQIIPPAMGRRVTLGIEGDDLTPQLAKYFGVEQGSGVLVSEVTLGGAADKAGVKAGDVITQVDGKPVRGVEDLRRALNQNFTGETRKVSLTVVREHHERTMTAELTRPWIEQDRTYLNLDPSVKMDLAELPATVGEIRARAEELRNLANSQRALIQSQVLEQQKILQKEWRQQLQEQLQSLKGFEVQKPQTTLNHNDEI